MWLACKSDLHFCYLAHVALTLQVRLLLLAALAGEHILFIGPPGTAKSELGRRLAGLYKGTFFERLLTRFSVPEVGSSLCLILLPFWACVRLKVAIPVQCLGILTKDNTVYCALSLPCV
jgi:hypothetical protein